MCDRVTRGKQGSGHVNILIRVRSGVVGCYKNIKPRLHTNLTSPVDWRDCGLKSLCLAWLVDQVCSVMFLHFNNFLQSKHFKLDGSTAHHTTIQILNIRLMQKEMFEVRPDWTHSLAEGHILMLECVECQSWLAV